MAKAKKETPLKIKFGKGELVLTKSNTLVGLRSMDDKTIEDKSIVKHQQHEHLAGFKVVEMKKKRGQALNERLDEVRGMDEIAQGTHIYYAPGSNRALVPTGSIYITFYAKTTQSEQEKILADLGLDLKERRDDDRVVATVTPKSQNPIKCAIALQQLDAVKWAEPDLDATVDNYAYAAPADNLFPEMWHLQNRGIVPSNSAIRLKVGADAKVVEAWRRLDGFGNPNIVVAVIDNGFDTTHPDLQGKILKPWDLWANSPTLRQGDPNFTHGTPCASVAIAPVNGSGMVGSAPVARFMPLSGTSYSIEGTEAMFNYCIRNGADIISCSWGTVDSQFAIGPDKIAAIAKAAREGRGGKGCIICYAAGNEDVDYVNYYGAHPDVICVAASTSDDLHASYSNRGREVTICAPSNGEWPILAARPFWAEGSVADFYYGDDVDRGVRYQHFGGTSSATPLVAGICALILSANNNLTAREVKQILMLTADKIGSPADYVNGHSVKYGYGRVNALKAVEEALRRKGVATGTTPVPPTPTPKPQTTPTAPTKPAAPLAGLLRWGTNAAVLAKGFAVQAGSFAQLENVTSIAPTLEAKFKQPVLWHIAGSGTTTVYRLLVGQFATQADAAKLQLTMKNGGVNGFVKEMATQVYRPETTPHHTPPRCIPRDDGTSGIWGSMYKNRR